jgi:hypothetical protein
MMIIGFGGQHQKMDDETELVERNESRSHGAACRTTEKGKATHATLAT